MKSRLVVSPETLAAERILERSCVVLQGRPVRRGNVSFNAKRNVELTTPVSRLLQTLSLRFGETISVPMVLKLMCSVSLLGGVHLRKENLYRLVLVASLLSHKMLDDEATYDSAEFAKQVGIPLGELNTMEREFLTLCKYKLFMSNEELTSYLHSLVRETLRQ